MRAYQGRAAAVLTETAKGVTMRPILEYLEEKQRKKEQQRLKKLTRQCWHGIRQRCNNPNAVGYKYYGGRGITVCDRWKIYKNFLADMGLKNQGDSIERINNDGNYEPSNCKWIPRTEQWRNRRETRDFSAMAKRWNQLRMLARQETK